MNSPARAFSTFAIVCAATACLRVAPQPRVGYWVASDSSQYSPVVRFRVVSRTAGTQLHVLLDSGVIDIPGSAALDAPVLMSQLYLTAFVAVLDSQALAVVAPSASGRPSDRRGWRPRATSDSVLIVDALRYGGHRPLPRTEFVLNSISSGAQPLWLIFRISGNTVEFRPPDAPGGAPLRRDLPGGVRVYACGNADLTGRFDGTRAATLKRAYGLTC